MQMRLYIPKAVSAPDDWNPAGRARVRQVVTQAILRAARAVSRTGLQVEVLDETPDASRPSADLNARSHGTPRERIDETRRLTGGYSYGVPSYGDEGKLVSVPVDADTASAEKKPVSVPLDADAAVTEHGDGDLVTNEGDRVIRKDFAETAVIFAQGLKFVYAGSNPYVIARNLPRALHWGYSLFGGLGFAVFNPKHSTKLEFYVVGLTESLDMQELKGFGEAFTAQGFEVSAVQRRAELIQQKDFYTVVVATRQGDVLLSSRMHEFWNVAAVGHALKNVPRGQRSVSHGSLLTASQRLLQPSVSAGDDQAIVDTIVNWDHTLFAVIPWETREHYVELLINAWTGDREEIAIIEIIKATHTVAVLEAIFALLRKNDLFDQLFDDLDGRVVDLLVLLSEFRPGGAVDWKYVASLLYSSNLFSPVLGSVRPLHDLEVAASGVLDWLQSTYGGIKQLLTKPGEVVEGLAHLAEFIWVLDKAQVGDPEAIAVLSRIVLQAASRTAKAIRGLEYAEELGSTYGMRSMGSTNVGEDIAGRLRAALIFEILTWFIGIGEVKAAIRAAGDLPQRLALLADALKALSGLSKIAQLGAEASKLERLLLILARGAEIAQDVRIARLAELMPREHLALLQRIAETANLPKGAGLEALKAALGHKAELLRGVDTLSASLKILDSLEATASKAGGLTTDMIEGARLILQAKGDDFTGLIRLFGEIAPEHLDEFTRTLKFLHPEHLQRWTTEALRQISQRPKAMSLIREAGGDLLDRVYTRAANWENVDRFVDKLAERRAKIGDPADYQRFVDRLNKGEIAAFDEVVGSSLLNRQLAARLRGDAASLEIDIKSLLEEAEKIEVRASKKAAGSVEKTAAMGRAAQRRRVATLLQENLADLKKKALDLENGLRSTLDLADPAEMEAEIDRLLREARAESDVIHVPLSETELEPAEAAASGKAEGAGTQQDLDNLRKAARTDPDAAHALVNRYKQMSDFELFRRFTDAGDETAAAIIRQQFPSNEAALRKVLGSNYRPPHSATAILRRGDLEVWRQPLQSGNMTAEERALGFPRNTLATHTEARAVQQPGILPGDNLEIRGQYDPCPSCVRTMRDAATKTGATIRYWWPGGSVVFP
jgi:hypothetical protein